MSTLHLVEPHLAQSDPEFVRRTFSSISKRYDFANHFLSGGMDFLWRKTMSSLVAARTPTRVLDLATGSGDLALSLAKACPSAEIVAADFCLPMLGQAAKKRVPRLVQADGLALPFADGVFDVVTVAFGLRNMADWKAALLEMHRVVRSGGAVMILDFSLPEREPVRSVYRFYLHRILPSIAGWATRRAEAYQYLGESIESFPSGPVMTALLRSCGFTPLAPRPMTFGVVSIYEAVKPD